MAGVGPAQVTIAFDAWHAGQVAPTHAAVAIIAPKSSLKIEAVSSRLKGALVHPNRTSVLQGIRFSPDGKRLIAGDYPGGVVAVWDVASGKQLTSIETGYGYRGSAEYFFLTQDWGKLFVARTGPRKYERVQQNGKRMNRWTFDGDVRVWDLASGRLERTYKHAPPRSFLGGMQLSPDGTTFVTFEELPGTYPDRAARAASLWDVNTGQFRALPEGLESYGCFSPDGHSLAIAAVDGDDYTQAVKLFDSGTGREKLSIPVKDKYVRAGVTTFSPDNRLLVGNYQRFEGPRDWKNSQSTFTWWDSATGREVASFAAAEKNAAIFRPRFSPDDRMLAAVNLNGEKGKLFLFRVPEKQLIHTVLLDDKSKDERLILIDPVFRPDGKQLAVISQAVPASAREELDAQDVPQPRIFLIDVASGRTQETLIAPQSFPRSASYSPDGGTLAVGGEGRVLLWDVLNLP